MPISKKTQLRRFQHDGWICYWGKAPVVFAPTFRLLETLVKKEGYSLPLFHSHWTREAAPLLDWLGAVIDHEIASSRQGSNDFENLRTACNKCNGRKSNLAVTDFKKRLHWPGENLKKPLLWDGLSGLFRALIEKNRQLASAGDLAWYRAMIELSSDVSAALS
jgi:5-methylcytosine-specific restriction endonuclease McrA